MRDYEAWPGVATWQVSSPLPGYFRIVCSDGQMFGVADVPKSFVMDFSGHVVCFDATRSGLRAAKEMLAIDPEMRR